MPSRDRALFDAAMQAAGVTPLRGKPRVQPPAPVPVGRRLRAEGLQPLDRPEPPPARGLRPIVADAPSTPGLDRATAQRLRRGRGEPEARIDLHGRTVADSERAFARFLERAQAEDMKLVLVITGKGWREEDGRLKGGRLREGFAAWINQPENRGRIVAVRPAHPRHGGAGAFYLTLKRRR